VRQNVDQRAARLAKHEAADSPLLVTEGIGDLEALLHGPGVDGIDVGHLTEMPGAAMSSLPIMVTWAEGLSGDVTVTTQPMSMATSKPSRSTKKSRVSAGRSDLMFGTARLILMLSFYPKSPGQAARETSQPLSKDSSLGSIISHAWRPRSAVPGGCGPSRTTSRVLPPWSWNSTCRFDGQASV
jgi:hypothetical protein